MKNIYLLVVFILIIITGVYLFKTNTKGSPSIAVNFPAAGDKLEIGATFPVTWETKNIPAENKISISLRRIPPPPLQTEGQEFDPIIFVDSPNTGSKDWTVSDNYPEGNYILDVTSYAGVPVTNPVIAESGIFSIKKGTIVGGDRDTHGCIGSAGYSWCEARKECTRVWETYCTSATAKTVTFKCDSSKNIVATFYPTDDKFVDLKLSDGRNISVPRAMSASGARYAKSDESFVFWNKGDTAFVTEGKESTETYSNCALK